MKQITITDMVELIMVVVGTTKCNCGLSNPELVVKMMSKVLDMTELTTEAKERAIIWITKKACFNPSHYQILLEGNLESAEQLLQYGREGAGARDHINSFLSGYWGQKK